MKTLLSRLELVLIAVLTVAAIGTGLLNAGLASGNLGAVHLSRRAVFGRVICPAATAFEHVNDARD